MSEVQKGWRDFIRVHPAAELFPLMTAEELDELARDIEVNGLKVSIETCLDEDGTQWLLDGRNRLDALERLGFRFSQEISPPKFPQLHLVMHKPKGWRTDFLPYPRTLQAVDFDPYTAVITFNLQRRHLTTEDRKRIAAEILAHRPEKSDRAIAKETKLSHPTVAAVRKEVEASTGKNFQLEPDGQPEPSKRIGADGKARKMPKTSKSAPAEVVKDAPPPATNENSEPVAPVAAQDHTSPHDKDASNHDAATCRYCLFRAAWRALDHCDTCKRARLDMLIDELIPEAWGAADIAQRQKMLEVIEDLDGNWNVDPDAALAAE